MHAPRPTPHAPVPTPRPGVRVATRRSRGWKVALLAVAVAVAAAGIGGGGAAASGGSGDGYSVNAGVDAAVADRTIRFYPSVPATTRLRVMWAANHYNLTGGTRITFGPDTTTPSVSISDITIEVLPGPLACGEVQGRACTWTKLGRYRGNNVKYAAHIQLGAQIVDRPREMKTILHELGHAFGLGHHDTPYLGKPQIMATPVSDQGALEQGDIAGIRYLVGKFDAPRGSVDAVTVTGSAAVSVAGWAFDANDPFGSVDLHVYVNGKYKRKLVANGTRSDVSSALGIAAPTGFSGQVAGLAGGANRVCVYAINRGWGSGNPLLGCRTVTLTGSLPKGSVDSVRKAGPGAISVAGWALDPDVTDPIAVTVTVNGWRKGTFTADAIRPDVGAAWPGWGDGHGYNLTVTTRTPGANRVCVYAVNVGGGTGDPLLGCRTVNV